MIHVNTDKLVITRGLSYTEAMLTARNVIETYTQAHATITKDERITNRMFQTLKKSGICYVLDRITTQSDIPDIEFYADASKSIKQNENTYLLKQLADLSATITDTFSYDQSSDDLKEIIHKCDVLHNCINKYLSKGE